MAQQSVAEQVTMTVKLVNFITVLVLPQVLFVHLGTSQRLSDGPCESAPPPHYWDITQCCEIPHTISEDVIMGCAADHGWEMKKRERGPPGQRDPQRSLAMCLSLQCAFNSSQVLDAAGDIDGTAWKEAIKSTSSDEWLAVQNPLIDSCIAKLKERSFSDEDQSECNHRNIAIGMCFFHESFLNCPASSYTSSPECDAKKEYVGNCFK